ncbi:efflux RND transporter permease subunit [Novipirellula artificiosorum]|uniref:Multidrug resistance protein MdtC n=1 Tax=Novipirellula artificiosorum TaxID=2528016 RepID=A0A5C6E5R8_9BACT|nr:efflux RND transporter permease subunit [Novipirellula artificiosorum]TWU42469.1 Multidrug resistance protein MdtC [Novipirellula artificiosorum]
MNLSDFSVRRPIAMGCLIIGLTLLGLNAYRKMGLELMPKMDAPFVTIVTVYPGAAPGELETDVAKRIEDAVVSLDGLKHVSSTCMENVCQTLLEFQMDVDVDVAATDVREKLDGIRAELPADVEDPKIQKFDINAKPIVNLALAGDVPLTDLYDFADNTLSDKLTVIPGVAEVQLIGGAEREVHVELDRSKLAARGLSSMDVVQAIQNAVRTIPSGRVRDGGTEYAVKFDADYHRVVDLEDLEVANDNGRRCYLRDVGGVKMATEELRQTATIDGRDCIAIKVVKKADANAVRVANAVRDAMQELNAQLPGGMDLVWVDDDGRFIEANNASAWVNVVQGILLTAAILFLFLYNVRTLFVVAITMPLTIVIGLFFMSVVSYTLNTSTLIAIGMSVGILVTNSIVVLEAIDKRLGTTGDPKEASRLGSSEAFIAVLASAGTNVVVLFPLAVMKSKIGMFIGPLAMTMFIMTVVSLFISFTLTPMLCSLVLKPREQESRSLLRRIERVWNWMFDRIVSAYRWSLTFAEQHRWAAALLLLAVAGMFVHSIKTAGTLGSSAFSQSDMGRLYLRLEFPTRYSLEETVRRVKQAEARVQDLPELKHVLTTVGKVEAMLGQSSEGVYLAQLLLKFSERDERSMTIADLMDSVRSRITGFPDAIVAVSQPSIIGGQSNPVELEIAGSELAMLDKLATKSLDLARQLDGFVESDTTVRQGKPEIRIEPRRAVLSDVGAPAVGLGLTLRANLEGIEAGTYKQDARNYDIVVKLDEVQGKRQIEEFQFPGTDRHPVLLTSFSHIRETEIPIQITRKNKRRITKLTSQLASSLPLGTAVSQLSQAIDQSKVLPPGYDYRFAGEYEMMNEAQGGLAEAGITAMILVVLTLAAIMESFRQPTLILITVPLALIGVFWALAIAGESISIFVIMGIVMMIGIVVNNAILIMDQFNVHVAEGFPRHEAMIEAACERFRPIVMITLAAVLGMLPLALGQGIGAEMRNGVGIASAGGILVSGVLTLLVLPILYCSFSHGLAKAKHEQHQVNGK